MQLIPTLPNNFLDLLYPLISSIKQSVHGFTAGDVKIQVPHSKLLLGVSWGSPPKWAFFWPEQLAAAYQAAKEVERPRGYSFWMNLDGEFNDFSWCFLEKDRKEMKRCWPFWASWANSWLFRVSWPSNSRLFYLIDRDWKCHYILVGFAPSRQIGWSGPETTSTAKYIGLGIPYKLCLSWSLKKISVPPDVKHLKLRPTQDRLGRHLWEPFQSNVEFRAWTQPVPPRQRRTKDAEHPCSCKCWGRDL